jgi:glycosyltransferase involved in cell wall biosynthesis
LKRPLKIVHVSRYYKMGGAAKAALRLHDALLEKGVESIFMSLDEDMNDSLHQINLRTYYNKPENLYYRIFNKIKRVISRHIKNSRAEIIEELKEILSQIKSEFVSLPFSDYRLEEHPAIKSADIIHLHWVADEMLDYQRFFSVCKKPVVWTLHDMNPIQGLFHYENDTIFNRKVAGRLDDKVLNIKIGAIRSFKKRIFIATPSEWLTKKVKESKIFNGLLSTTIPNSLDQTVFCLRSQNEIREELGLPLNEIIILFAAESLENFRKGFDLLIESLLLVKKYRPSSCNIRG